jgi:hypothetical protein
MVFLAWRPVKIRDILCLSKENGRVTAGRYGNPASLFLHA